MALQGHYKQHFGQPKAASLLARAGLSRLLPPLFTKKLDATSDQRHRHFWQSPQELSQESGDVLLAQQMYRGIFEFAGERITSTPDQLFQPGTGSRDWSNSLRNLDWLQHFAVQPRKLGACFVANIMKAWNYKTTSPQDVDSEALRLLNMQRSFPILAPLVEEPQRQILMQAFAIQYGKLKAVQPCDLMEATHQALSLARATLALQDLSENLMEDLRRLDTTLVKQTLPDGGPTSGSIAKHALLLGSLLDLETALERRGLSMRTPSTLVRDRMAGFLAMFQRSDGSLAFDLPQHNQTAIDPSAGSGIQRLAARSGVARLCHGRSVLVAANGPGFDTPCVDFSTGKTPLLCFGGFHMPDNNAAPELVESNQGSVLRLANRQIFLAASGHDIRIQEELRAQFPTQPLLLNFNTNVRISLARQSGRVSLALPDRTHWQLSIRGGNISACKNESQLLLTPNGQGDSQLNWALKRIVEDSTARSARAEEKSKQVAGLLL